MGECFPSTSPEPTNLSPPPSFPSGPLAPPPGRLAWGGRPLPSPTLGVPSLCLPPPLPLFLWNSLGLRNNKIKNPSVTGGSGSPGFWKWGWKVTMLGAVEALGPLRTSRYPLAGLPKIFESEPRKKIPGWSNLIADLVAAPLSLPSPYLPCPFPVLPFLLSTTLVFPVLPLLPYLLRGPWNLPPSLTYLSGHPSSSPSLNCR